MSPYPSQTDRETIIEAAWEMIEANGLDNLTLKSLAKAIGVRAPSLYRHVASKADMLRGVNERTAQYLFIALQSAMNDATDLPPPDQLMAVAGAFRQFAHEHPITYALLFTAQPKTQPDPAELERAVLPLQAVVAAISGEAESLTALRGLLALLHGYVILELNGQFRRGGDLEATFTRTVAAYLRGWSTG